ncbi:MAG: hypothetical protein IPJ33_00200 [Gammaproteobacteria bacterium]|jgi:hypothetical protein|nr:hypothetical protein [Gammaproteobacteria bacterium]MBK7167712.1 hypothetical protein [Gammaproteobacteria bacterium]MBK7726967.1 hypothetical protein [Gammaproteobacteria bacterium]MBP6053708.1 hypothetical protein [Pseudomonadales bacterium]
MTASMSEEFSSAKAGSNRSFGVVFVVAFALIGLFPLVREEAVRTWALLVSGAFLVPTLVYPQVLAPLNKLWFRFGMLLGRIINPVVMFIMYALVMVPVGLVLKLMRKDLLRLKPDARASTYWIQRTPPGPTPESLKDQF